MSDKLSINVEVPGINTTHNFIVPKDMSVSKMTTLILKTYYDEYPETEKGLDVGHMLIQANSGKALNGSCSLKQLGIVSGEKLIFV